MLACNSSADSMATVCKTHARAHARVQERQRVVHFLSGDLTVAVSLTGSADLSGRVSLRCADNMDGGRSSETRRVCVCVVGLRVLPVSLSRHCISPSHPCQVEEAFSAAMDVGGAYCVARRKQPLHNWEHRNILEL